jgi:hypothetical protein
MRGRVPRRSAPWGDSDLGNLGVFRSEMKKSGERENAATSSPRKLLSRQIG